MLITVWLIQGLMYTLQIVYLVFGSMVGTLIYKLLKPRPYGHVLIRCIRLFGSVSIRWIILVFLRDIPCMQ